MMTITVARLAIMIIARLAFMTTIPAAVAVIALGGIGIVYMGSHICITAAAFGLGEGKL